jgi:hypothetical protein
MATIRELADGLAILRKYDPDGDVAAEHDIVYAGHAEDFTLTADDASRMEELGWFVDDEYDSWARFV